MSKHIAGKLNPIPSAVFASFQAVITARSTMYAALQQIVNKKPDPDIVRGNATRKHFIDPLTEAFEALGGSSWHSSTGPLAVKDAEDHLLLQNRVSALSLGVTKDRDDDVALSEDDAYSIQARRQKKRTGKGKERKGKKGKRGRKSKSKTSTEATAEPALSGVPVESYRIIEDKDGLMSEYLMSEYLMAVYAVVQEWIQLRSFSQNLWKEVALTIFAAEFERLRIGALSCIFWDDLRKGEEWGGKLERDDDEVPTDVCSVM